MCRHMLQGLRQARVEAHSDRDLAAQVMKATLEIRSGSLGPGVRPDLLPVGSLVLPRFGVTQNSKGGQ